MVVQIHYDPMTIVKSRSHNHVHMSGCYLDLMTNAKATEHEIGLNSLSIQHIRVRNENVQQPGFNCATFPCWP